MPSTVSSDSSHKEKSRIGTSCMAGTRLHSLWVDSGLERVNDPSAGSPTETLLRLLLPLNEQV
jgi:hypothetical protein